MENNLKENKNEKKNKMKLKSIIFISDTFDNISNTVYYLSILVGMNTS